MQKYSRSSNIPHTKGNISFTLGLDLNMEKSIS